MIVAGVNGIETDGSTSTDLLLAHLEALGVETIDVSYPEVHWWNARYTRVQRRAAEHVADQVPPGASIVAHSFGCLATWLAMRSYDLGPERVWFFGAALDRDADLRDCQFGSLMNVRYENDVALRGAWVHRLLPLGNPMGTAGKYGLRTNDFRVEQLRFPPYAHEQGPTDPLSHSHYFQGANVRWWATEIAKTLRRDERGE